MKDIRTGPNQMRSGATLAQRLGTLTGDRYRTIPRARIIDMLLLGGSAFELARGCSAQAAAHTEAALARWVELGLGFAVNAAGATCFDPVEVINFLILAGHSGLDPFWAGSFVRTGRRLLATARPAGPFHVTFSRAFDLAAFAPGAAVRLRLPAPLPGITASNVTITPILPPETAADVTVTPGRMEVRLPVPHGRQVEIGMDIVFTPGPRPPAAALTEQESALYLRPREGLIQLSPRIEALARHLAGTNAAPWRMLQAFWDYMTDGFYCGAIHYDQLGTTPAGDWVLEHGWYDCQLGAALFAALCRAAAIPARIASGHLLYPLAPTNHFWAEAWIDGHGWLPFDFLSWGLSLGGRDSAWRRHFFGKIDVRMVTQLLPLAFTGPMSVRFPAAWHMLQTAAPGGVAIEFLELDGRLIYRDKVTVR